jgi:secreted trypsin-like serine protease
VVNNRVVNGQVTAVGDWGWSVSITRNGRHHCGGVLINKDYILSAAHCFSGMPVTAASFQVDIGVHNTQVKESWVQTRGVSVLKNHESYNPSLIKNDIAILKLDRSVTPDNKYVVPVCLPEVGTFDYQGKKGTVTGWGDQFYQSGKGSVTKREGQQDILTDAKCKSKYSRYQLNPVGQVCAGESTQYGGSCHGDSGGPFVIKHTDNKYYAYGVVSFGEDCGYGTVYTRISYYMPWIKRNMV